MCIVTSASSPFIPTGKPPASSTGPRRMAVNVPGMTVIPSTMLWPSRANRNWNWNTVSRRRMWWNQVMWSVRGSSIAPTQPISGSSNQGTAYITVSSPSTQSASTRMMISASVTAMARLRAADWRRLGPVSTHPRACRKFSNSSSATCAVSSVEPSLDTTTWTGPP
jgi:hypothetical protein